jgi:hypothetical protein
MAVFAAETRFVDDRGNKSQSHRRGVRSMQRLIIALMLLWPMLASAGVVNVEFKFTPYTGDLKQDQVQTVPGKAQVFINNMLYAEQDVQKEMVPVIFDDREIAPSVWVPMNSAGPILRKGKNSVRIEFLPSDAKAPYNAQLTWASVMDQTTETESSPGTSTSTNQSGEGMDSKKASGKIVFERDFIADFATDRAWHHYPAVASLSDADKQQIAAAVAARAAGFKPGFVDSYKLLEGQEGVDLAAIKKSKCLDSAYAVGVRVTAPTADQMEYSLTGNPEVVVSRKGGALFDTGKPELFAKIKGDDNQMCAGMVISVSYPPRLSFVRTPAGAWEVVY